MPVLNAKRLFQSHRPRIAWLLVISFLTVGSVILWLDANRYGALRAWLDDPYGELGPFKPSSMLVKWYSESYLQRAAYLRNDLLRRSSPWTMVEAQELLDVFKQGAPYEQARELADQLLRQGLEATPELLRLNERWMLYSGAVSVAIERLRKDALGRPDRQIEPEARRALEDALITMLNDPSPDIRREGWVAMLESGLVERPEIRQRLEDLARTDPDEDIRRNLAKHLDHYDRTKALAEQYRQTFFASSREDGQAPEKQESPGER